MLEPERRFGMHICTQNPELTRLHHWTVEFENGYRASIKPEWDWDIDKEGLDDYEIGIFHNDEFCMQPILIYSGTPIRHLTEPAVIAILDQLAQLPYTPTDHEHVL